MRLVGALDACPLHEQTYGGVLHEVLGSLAITGEHVRRPLQAPGVGLPELSVARRRDVHTLSDAPATRKVA